MKTILRLALALVLAFGATMDMSAQKGEAVFGAQTGFTSTNKSAIAGLFFQYGLTDYLRIAPEVGCVFRHHDKDAFTTDVNIHAPMKITESIIDLYPLVGLNYSSWGTHHIKPDLADTDDVSTRVSRFGLNIGAGFGLRASSTLKVKAEIKYVLMKKYNTCVLSVGIGYVF